MESDTGTAGARLEEETARGPQREHGHDALGPAAGESVAMPAGAVLASAVEVEPEIVVAHPVVRRQGVAGSNQPWVGGVGKLAVLRRQSRLQGPLPEEPPPVLLPGHPLGSPLETLGGAAQPC